MAFQKGSLTALFNRRRSGLVLGKSIPVQMEHIHPASGARLFVVKIENKSRPVNGPYIVGWLARGEKTSWFYRNFETEMESLAFFKKHKDMGPPTYNHFLGDDQVNKVYQWEKEFRMNTVALDRPQMEQIVEQLSSIFNMAAPKIIYKPDPAHNVYAVARLKENEIFLRRPNLAILLHEFAHLVNDQVNKDVWAWHGAGFMRTYLSILALYPGLAGEKDPAALAHEHKLEIANEKDIVSCQQLKTWLKHHKMGTAPNLMLSAA